MKELLEKNKPKKRLNSDGSELTKKTLSDNSVKSYESSGDKSFHSNVSGVSTVTTCISQKFPDTPSLQIYNNEDHNSTCGRIVAQGKFSKLLSVGYVQHAIEHHKEEIEVKREMKMKMQLMKGVSEGGDTMLHSFLPLVL